MREWFLQCQQCQRGFSFHALRLPAEGVACPYCASEEADRAQVAQMTTLPLPAISDANSEQWTGMERLRLGKLRKRVQEGEKSDYPGSVSGAFRIEEMPKGRTLGDEVRAVLRRRMDGGNGEEGGQR